MKNVILIDNSTYFSFRMLTQGGELDAAALYNSLKLIEALVTVDEIRTAPTGRWTPSETDHLFGTGICVPIRVENYSDYQLRQLFSVAIENCLGDLKESKVRSLLRATPQVSKATISILNAFRERCQSPREFFQHEYSDVVFMTDPNSQAYMRAAQIRSEIGQHATRASHLAHYLLRTRMAMEVAAAQESYGIPYHPHSHRTKFVFDQLIQEGNHEAFGAGTLVRYLQREIKQRNSKLDSGLDIVSLVGDRGQTPIIATVLSGSNDVVDITPRALEIRHSKQAKQYREFVGKLMKAFQSADATVVIKAKRDLAEAKAELDKELDQLYGSANKKGGGIFPYLIGRIAHDVTLNAPQTAPTAAVVGAVATAVTEALVDKAKSIPSTFRRRAIRRNVALLLQFAKGSGRDAFFRGTLQKTFKRDFTANERAAFAELIKDPVTV